jgi:hypothetical protein
MSRNLSRSGGNGSTRDTSGKITAASDELIQNLGQIVWTINPANDSFANIVAFIRNYLSKLFEENADILLKLDLPEPNAIPEGIAFNPEQKHNMILILKECITKHRQTFAGNRSVRLAEA